MDHAATASDLADFEVAVYRHVLKSPFAYGQRVYRRSN
jgi:hypothetical protein